MRSIKPFLDFLYCIVLYSHAWHKCQVGFKFIDHDYRSNGIAKPRRTGDQDFSQLPGPNLVLIHSEVLSTRELLPPMMQLYTQEMDICLSQIPVNGFTGPAFWQFYPPACTSRSPQSTSFLAQKFQILDKE